MIFFSQLIVSILYFFLGSIFSNTKHFIVVGVEMVAGGEVSGEANIDGSITEMEFGGCSYKLSGLKT